MIAHEFTIALLHTSDLQTLIKSFGALNRTGMVLTPVRTARPSDDDELQRLNKPI